MKSWLRIFFRWFSFFFFQDTTEKKKKYFKGIENDLGCENKNKDKNRNENKYKIKIDTKNENKKRKNGEDISPAHRDFKSSSYYICKLKK